MQQKQFSALSADCTNIRCLNWNFNEIFPGFYPGIQALHQHGRWVKTDHLLEQQCEVHFCIFPFLKLCCLEYISTRKLQSTSEVLQIKFILIFFTTCWQIQHLYEINCTYYLFTFGALGSESQKPSRKTCVKVSALKSDTSSWWSAGSAIFGNSLFKQSLVLLIC